MAITRLLYRSDSELIGSARAIREAAFAIADDATLRNERVGVTGALMFAGSVFVQLLEGDGKAVEETFERICRDMRHRRLALLDFSGTDRRVFKTRMVAFEGDARARELFPPMSATTSFARRNRLSANMAIDLMSRLYERRVAKPKRQPDDWMIATNVLD